MADHKTPEKTSTLFESNSSIELDLESNLESASDSNLSSNSNSNFESDAASQRETENTQLMLSTEELEKTWQALSIADLIDALNLLSTTEAEKFWRSIDATHQAEILSALAPTELKKWIQRLDPDDITDVIQASALHMQESILGALDPKVRSEVTDLLGHEDDLAGGLMTSRYLAVSEQFFVFQAIDAIRRRFREEKSGSFHYIYVLNSEKLLVGVLSLRELFLSQPDSKICDVMRSELVVVKQELEQEEVARVFTRNSYSALPVVDHQGKMIGIVTLDDIVDVVEEEATEDFQKLGASEALEKPYLRNSVFDMFRKRAGWLTMLFIGSTLTTSAMNHYESQIQKLLMLTVFIPLVISSGGNAGSQASTLIVRAIALQEVRLKDWWRVLLREFGFGLLLGAFIGSLGFSLIVFFPGSASVFGSQYFGIGVTICLSLLSNIMWGTVVGSMLPFVLKRLRFDPASASTPFVATIVDVTGITIYFTVAAAVLSEF